MKKRIISLLLAVVMVLSLAPMTVLAEETAATEAFEIATADDLKAFRDRVNAGETDLDAVLTADIDLAMGDPTVTPKVHWVPIGTPNYTVPTGETPYTGVFDGQGHTISGISYYFYNSYGELASFGYPNETENKDSVRPIQLGLFGHVSGATIKDLTVEGLGFTKGRVTSESKLGGIVGYAQNATIVGCTNKVVWTGDTSASGGAHQNLGGIVGYAEGCTIDKCANEADMLTFTFAKVGGIVGRVVKADAPTVISNCCNVADITANDAMGGIVGYMEGHANNSETPNTVTNCYSIGKIGRVMKIYSGAWTTSYGNGGGGIIGNFAKDAAETATANAVAVSNCYTVVDIAEGPKADGRVTNAFAASTPGGLVVFNNNYFRSGAEQVNDYAFATGKAAADMQTREFVEALGDGFVYVEGDFPVLSWQCEHTVEDATYEAGVGGVHTVSPICGGCGISMGESYEEECEVEAGSIYCAKCGSMVDGAVFEIADAEDLIAFRDLVNSGITNVDAVLTADIDLGMTDPQTTKAHWIPIGTPKATYTNPTCETPYTGVFDGQGHTISGISFYFHNVYGELASFGYVNEDVNNDANRAFQIGLFGHVDGATIKNVTVGGLGYTDGRQTMYSKIGAVVGYAQNATIIGCTNKVVWSGSCSASSGFHDSLGGIVGYAEGCTIDKCGNEVDMLTATFRKIGGIVGQVVKADVPTVITNCYNVGDITGNDMAGGIVGYMEGYADNAEIPNTIEDCYSIGIMGRIMRVYTNGAWTYAYGNAGGGIVGNFAKDAANTAVIKSAKVKDCYAVAETHPDALADGKMGNAIACGTPGGMVVFENVYYYANDKINAYSSAIGKTAEEMKTLAFAEALGEAFVLADGSEYPILDWQCEHDLSEQIIPNGNRTHDLVYKCLYCSKIGEITADDQLCTDENSDDKCDVCGGSTVAETRVIASEADLIAFATEVNSGYVLLNAELAGNITLTAQWIKNLKSNAIGSDARPWQGTFDGKGYTISGLDMAFSNVNTTLGDAAGTDLNREFRIGLFANVKNATIKNLTVEGTIQMEGRQCEACAIAGVAAIAENTTFENVVNKVSLSGVGNYNWGTFKNVGGIVGKGTCITMTNCGNEAELHIMGDKMGALVGSLYGTSTILDCYNTANVTGTKELGGLVGPVSLEEDDTFTMRNCYSTGNFDVFRKGDVDEETGEYYDFIWHAGLIYSIGGGTVTVENCYVSGSSQAPETDKDKYLHSLVSFVAEGTDVTFTNNYYVNRGEEETIASSVTAEDLATVDFAKTLGDGYVLMNDGTSPALEWQCDHDMTAEVCVSNGDGTHNTISECANCSKQGDVISENEACADADTDGYCDDCGAVVETEAPEIEKFNVAGVNMTLGNELELNIMLTKATVDAYGKDLSVTVIHHEYVDGDTEYTFKMSELPLYGGNRYYKASIRVAAAQMTDLVDVVVTDAEGNVYSNEFTTSVLTYVTNNLDKQTAKVKTLLVDMVNYGAAAQDQFTYRQDLYANSNLTDAQKLLATGDVTCTDIRVKGTNYVGSNLSLQDCILLNFMFTGVADDVRETMYATVSFTGVLGNEVNVRVPVEKLMTRYAGVAVNQIVLADAVTPVTVTLYNADGSVYGYATDSVESYNARQNPNGDNALYTNIMKFAASALAYKK